VNRDDHARKAADILRENQPLAAEEEHAAKVIRDGQWILWHAHDRDLAVARLLHRAHLLRDPDYEQQQERQLASHREATKREHAATRVHAGALSAIVTETLDALRCGADPAALADKVAAAYDRADRAYEMERRP
jgi:hypothetical protein